MSSSKSHGGGEQPSAERIAVLGGDGRIGRQGRTPKVRIFKAARFAGNGPLRGLEKALRAGGIDRVVILARWNSHSATTRIRRVCRLLGVPVEIHP